MKNILLVLLSFSFAFASNGQGKITARLSTATGGTPTSTEGFLLLQDSLTKYAPKHRVDTLRNSLYSLKANVNHGHLSTDITNWLSATRSAFSAGTDISIVNGIVSYTGTSGSGGGLSQAQVNALIASKTGVTYVIDFGVRNPTRLIDGVNVGVPNDGAVGTGYNLAVYYANLSDAQIDFPTAIALTDVIDGLAVQNAIDFCCYDPAAKNNVIVLPDGNLYFTRPVSLGYGIPFLDAGGQTRNYVSLVVMGSKASRGARTPTEKSTTIYTLFNDAPAISVQGNSKSIVQDMVFVGRNTGIPANGGLYGYNAQKIENYISPYNTSTDGMGIGWNLEAHRYSPYTAVAIDPYSGSPNEWAGPPSGITYIPYPDVVINPKYFTSGQRYQWYKGVSTDVRLVNLDISNFITGYVVHPNGSDGNGDFIRVTGCNVSGNMIGGAYCQSQGRNATFDYGAMDYNHTAFSMDAFGRREGRFMGGTGTHISGARLFSASNMSICGPVHFDTYYAESLGRLGDFGYEIANTAFPTFSSCDFNFGHQESGFTPLNILNGYTAVFENTRLYGRNIDIKSEVPPTISNCLLEIAPAGALNATWPFDTDINNTYYYYRAFFNHPISTGTAKKINAIGNNIVQTHINKALFNETRFGTNAYKYIEAPNTSPGLSGELHDYVWSSNSIFVGSGYMSFTGGHLKVNINNIGYARQIIKDLIKEGDILEIPGYGFKFMVYARNADTCDAVLLNGFNDALNEYDMGKYNLAQMQALLSNTDLVWTWFNNNFTDATSSLQYNRQWAIKANVTAGSPNVTGIEYVTPLDNGSRPEAVENIFPSYIIQYYGYTGMASMPTTKMETNIIQSVNIGAKTAVLKNNSTITGQVLFFSKWPYDRR